MASQKTTTKSTRGKTQATTLETLKNLGASPIQSLKEDLFDKAPQDFFDQLMGTNKYQKNYSGEITPGESMHMNEIFSGEREEKLKLQRQLALERRLRQEEQERSQRKSQELRLQLQALMQELAQLSHSTQELTEETKIASMQAPVEPGVYHVTFFQKLIEFVRSFIQTVDDAAIWLQGSNKRAQKKNYWAKYKDKKNGGSKFLLSADHYLTRSAG